MIEKPNDKKLLAEASRKFTQGFKTIIWKVENDVNIPVNDVNIPVDELFGTWEDFISKLSEEHPEITTVLSGEAREKARQKWQAGVNLIQALIEDQRAQYEAQIAELENQNQELKARVYSDYPSNTATWLSKQVLNSPHRATHGKIKMREYEKEQRRVFSYRASPSSGEVSLTLSRINKLFNKRIQNGVKLFSFFTKKLDQQNYADETFFDLQELVDLGIYKTLNSAYQGVTNAVKKMMWIHIDGTYLDYEKGVKVEKANKGGPLISWREITYNRCHIRFPTIFRDRKPQITVLPDWAFSLSDNAFMFVDYIFYLARTNKETSFNVNLDTVRGHLGYLSAEEVKENKGRHYQQLIVEPMQNIIAEVLEAAKGQPDIKIEQIYDTSKVIVDGRKVTVDRVENYLDGYIHVELTGEPAIYIEARKKDATHEKKAEQGRINRAIARKNAKKKPDDNADSEAKNS